MGVPSCMETTIWFLFSVSGWVLTQFHVRLVRCRDVSSRAPKQKTSILSPKIRTLTFSRPEKGCLIVRK